MINGTLARWKEWARQANWAPLAICLGFLLGCIVRFPLVPWSLSDSSASIIGSALGAAGAVAGSVLITNFMIDGEDRAMRETLAVCLRPLIGKLDEVIVEARKFMELDLEHMSGEQRGTAFARVLAPAYNSRRVVEIAMNRINLLRDSSTRLRAAGAIAYADAVLSVQGLQSALNEFHDDQVPVLQRVYQLHLIVEIEQLNIMHVIGDLRLHSSVNDIDLHTSK